MRNHWVAVSVVTLAVLSPAPFADADGPPEATVEIIAGGGFAIRGGTGLHADAGGYLYVADLENRRVHRLNLATHGLETVAGNGMEGNEGDGGPAINASLVSPADTFVDSVGNLYILDRQRIRKVQRTAGVISTVAMFGGSGFARGRDGSFYVVRPGRGFIYRVNPDSGTVTVFAGTGYVAGNNYEDKSGDGGPATDARLMADDICADAAGRFYIADRIHHRVRRIDENGIITTVAPAEGDTTGMDPRRLTVDHTGSLLVENAGTLLRIQPTTGAVSTVSTFRGRTPLPNDVAVDHTGKVFAASYNLVFEIADDGEVAAIFGEDVGDGGPAIEAVFIGPQGVSLAGPGSLLVGDIGSALGTTAGQPVTRVVNLETGLIDMYAGIFGHPSPSEPGVYYGLYAGRRILRWDSVRSDTLTVAGGGNQEVTVEGVPGQLARLGLTHDLCVAPDGHVYTCDYTSSRIGGHVRRFDPTTGVLKTIAGNGSPEFSGDGGQATAAGLMDPRALAVDDAYLYVADSWHRRIRRIDLGTGLITTIAGNGATGVSGDGGPAIEAALGSVRDLAVDRDGNLYVSIGSHGIRRVGLDGIITSVTDLPSGGIELDELGRLYVVDSVNHLVRRISFAARGGSPVPLPSDFDGSGVVDFADFVRFAFAFGSDNPDFDLDGDGAVGFSDFVRFAADFGNTTE